MISGSLVVVVHESGIVWTTDGSLDVIGNVISADWGEVGVTAPHLCGGATI